MSLYQLKTITNFHCQWPFAICFQPIFPQLYHSKFLHSSERVHSSFPEHTTHLYNFLPFFVLAILLGCLLPLFYLHILQVSIQILPSLQNLLLLCFTNPMLSENYTTRYSLQQFGLTYCYFIIFI